MKRLLFVSIFFIANVALVANAMPNKPGSIRDFSVSKMRELTSKNIQSRFGKPDCKVAILQCPDGSLVNALTFCFRNGYYFTAYMFHGKLAGYTVEIVDDDKTTANTFAEASEQLGISTADLEKTFQSPSYGNFCVRTYKGNSVNHVKEISTTQDGSCDLATSPVIMVNVDFDNYPDGCVILDD